MLNSYCYSRSMNSGTLDNFAMKLSSRARYAMRLMIEIAIRNDGEAVSLGYVARKTSISRRYLDQLVQGLKQASLVRGLSGRGGGYRLTRPASEISVEQIIEAAIGPINIVDCVGHPEICRVSHSCDCRWVYGQVNRQISDVLNGISLAELAERSAEQNTDQGTDTEMYGCPA